MRSRHRWVVGLLLVAAGRVLSPQAVPVYDGVGNPDEPYRHADRDPRAAGAQTQVPAAGDSFGPVRLQTPEKGPQFLLDVPAGTLRPTDTGAPAIGPFRVTAEPLAADGTLARGAFDSNTYEVSTDPQTRAAAPGGSVFLRAETMTRPDPVLVYRATADQPWSEQASTRASRDVIGGPFRGPGQYALIRLPGAQDLGSAGPGRMTTVLLVALVAVLLTITIVFLRQERDDLD